ncbi:MAG TPA: non-homologous end-joining DNA ligase [Micropepsaceae bacterium]|nr:non-homologous end-joining DNA ligase [Micropepsaceae bacterium]
MSENIHGVALTHPEKVLYPEQGITKRALAEYYEAIAESILPFVRLRPISLVRCPAGQAHKCFFQRHAGSGIPPQIKEIEIPGFEESGAYLYFTTAAGLIALVQMGVLEIHPWGCRTDKPQRPDRVTFDLDPGEGLDFKDVIAGAKEVRKFLTGVGLKSFVKTTGGKGLHVQLPIARRYSWPQVKSFAKRAAELIAAAAPDRYLTRIPIAERKGRIFIDYLRNDPTSTSVAAYSTRARPGAPVSTPLDWDELTAELDPAKFNVLTVPKRLHRIRRDPWSGMEKLNQLLPQFPT